MKLMVAGILTISMLCGADIANQSDDFYATMDSENDNIILAAHESSRNDDNGVSLFRKRAHKRKKKIRPPSRGK